MATTIVLGEGKAQAVWDDRWRPLLEALGSLQVERATSIEWEADTRDWVAIHLPTGTPIARGPHRDAVVAQEVAWLEARQQELQGVARSIPTITIHNPPQSLGHPSKVIQGEQTS